jgi:endogenous inhibitor of DNA gyrase (YacG/DUF329 family)
LTVTIDTVRCPTCRQPADWGGNPFRPFCSERCRLQDLGNWVSERYCIPGAATDAEVAEDGDRDDAR